MLLGNLAKLTVEAIVVAVSLSLASIDTQSTFFRAY